MGIKDKIESYFNLYIERSKLELENNDIIDLSTELIDSVYSGKTVNLERISELDIIYEQMVANTEPEVEPSNDIQRQIDVINVEMAELTPEILQFFDITGALSVLYNIDKGNIYIMSVNDGGIFITN